MLGSGFSFFLFAWSLKLASGQHSGFFTNKHWALCFVQQHGVKEAAQREHHFWDWLHGGEGMISRRKQT